MHTSRRVRPTLVGLCVLGCSGAPGAEPVGTSEPEVPAGAVAVRSPGGDLELVLEIRDIGGEAGVPTYRVAFRGLGVVRESRLGVDLADGGHLASGLRVAAVGRRREDRTVTLFPGKASAARDRFEEADVTLATSDGSRPALGIVLRAYDDGRASPRSVRPAVEFA